MSNAQLKERLETEGVEYFLSRIQASEIDDLIIRALWRRAQDAMGRLDGFCEKIADKLNLE